MNGETIINSNGELTELEKTKAQTDRKCPQCGGTMDFYPQTGGLKCPYCDYEEAIASGETAMEIDIAKAEYDKSVNWGADKKTVICKSCGAESIYDALQVASECPYCGSNQVMSEAGKDTLAPNGVCPFKVDANTAGEKFTSWIKGRLFCPSKAKRSAKPEAFSGVYLPYWTFDADTLSKYTAKYGKDRHYTDKDGKTHTETDWYSTAGSYSEFIDDELVPASARQDQSLLSKIEPFETDKSVAYKPEYLAGFAAERYSTGIKEAWKSAQETIKSHLGGKISEKIRHEHNADHVSDLRFDTVFSAVKYKYLMLPVWMSSFKYKDKLYQFLVNGQTGEVGGKTPVSALRVIIAVIIILAVLIGLGALLVNVF